MLLRRGGGFAGAIAGVSMAYLLGCGPEWQPQDVKQMDVHATDRDVLAQVTGDARAIRGLMVDEVVNGGLLFADPSCTLAFPTAGIVKGKRLDAFAACLAGLHFTPAPREDPFGDVVVLTYPPGIELEAQVRPEITGPRLTWIGYEARETESDRLPTISDRALEALRISGDRNGPIDPAAAKPLLASLRPGLHYGEAWVKVCMDATGTVTSVSPREETSSALARAFVAAAKSWRFRPFQLGGQAVPACAMVRMTLPAQPPSDRETLPFPRPASALGKPLPDDDPRPVVARHLIGGHRVAGIAAIPPDVATGQLIYQSGYTELIGAFRVCLDPAGKVTDVDLIRSTGFAAYDQELENGIHTWAYAPYLVDGKPVAVCTQVTFKYRPR